MSQYATLSMGTWRWYPLSFDPTRGKLYTPDGICAGFMTAAQWAEFSRGAA